ncbi:hypothetical protein ACFV3E_34180 [Streptomyces sp. NPDC059718]
MHRTAGPERDGEAGQFLVLPLRLGQQLVICCGQAPMVQVLAFEPPGIAALMPLDTYGCRPVGGNRREELFLVVVLDDRGLVCTVVRRVSLFGAAQVREEADGSMAIGYRGGGYMRVVQAQGLQIGEQVLEFFCGWLLVVPESVLPPVGDADLHVEAVAAAFEFGGGNVSVRFEFIGRCLHDTRVLVGSGTGSYFAGEGECQSLHEVGVAGPPFIDQFDGVPSGAVLADVGVK